MMRRLWIECVAGKTIVRSDVPEVFADQMSMGTSDRSTSSQPFIFIARCCMCCVLVCYVSDNSVINKMLNNTRLMRIRSYALVWRLYL